MNIKFYDVWIQNHTVYGAVILESNYFSEHYHGKYLVVLWGHDRVGVNNFYDGGYISPDYVREHFGVKSEKDAQSFADRLNEVFNDE